MPRSFYIIGFFLSLFLASCGAPYEPVVHSGDFSDNTINEVLHNIENQQKDSIRFAELGRNPYARFLNIVLLISAIMTGASAAIEGSALWKKTAKSRLVLLLILSISATIFTATGLYVKNESDRFFTDNRNKFTALSLEMNSSIEEFYLAVMRSEYNQNSVEDPAVRKEFLTLAESTFQKLRDLRKDYNDKYGLDTN